MNEIAVTAVGSDRPGIVAALTQPLLDLGGNLADCRAALLRGSFAVALLVTVPDEVDAARVDAMLRPVAERMGLGLWTGPAAAHDEAEAWGPRCIISVYGIDHPGIVHAVSATLAETGVNILDLSARVAGSPPIYALGIEADLPPGGTPHTLEAALRPVAEANRLELSVTLASDDVL
ncbi:MAG: ACT domain-containing protein [Thermoleophilia bacterium]